MDEGDLKPLLDRVVERYPDVDVGSYPKWHDPTYKTKITFDGRDELASARRTTRSSRRCPKASLRSSDAQLRWPNFGQDTSSRTAHRVVMRPRLPGLDDDATFTLQSAMAPTMAYAAQPKNGSQSQSDKDAVQTLVEQMRSAIIGVDQPGRPPLAFGPGTEPAPIANINDTIGPPVGDATLILRRFDTLTKAKQVAFSTTVPLGTGDVFTFGATETNHVDELSLQVASQPLYPLSASFTTTGLGLNNPAEAQLYARDPEELGRFVDTLETDPDAVRAQVGTNAQPLVDFSSGFANAVSLPDALAMVSPAQIPHTTAVLGTGLVFSDGIAANVDPLREKDFFGNRFAIGTSAKPTGFGSVKAARITYPGLCTLEQLYARPTPALPRAPGYSSIFANIQASLVQFFSEVCERLQGVNVRSVTGFPLLRHSPSHAGDARAQFFLNLDVSAWHWFGGCRTQISALYDVFLDQRGALTFAIAIDPRFVPHGGVRPAIDVADDHGSLCSRFDLVGPHGEPDGLTGALVNVLLETLPLRLNADLRMVQGFPQPAQLMAGVVNGNTWSCNPTTTLPDPLNEVASPRYTYKSSVKLSDQMQLGVGYMNGGNAACANAQNDLCFHLRQAYGLRFNHPQPVCGLGCCNLLPTDPLALRNMLSAIMATDAQGDFLYWGCRETDPGNQDCLSTSTPFQLNCATPNGCVLTSTPCASGTCVSRLGVGSPVDLSGSTAHSDTFTASSISPFGCTPQTASGSCMFFPPAVRLIANPDGIQLVLFDNDFDTQNAARAFELALHSYLAIPIGPASNTFPSFFANPSPSYVGGKPIERVAFLDQRTTAQGRWNPAYSALSANPLLAATLCNYNRFNDLEGQPGPEYVGDFSIPAGTDDLFGNPWRSFTFPRRYAVYTGLSGFQPCSVVSAGFDDAYLGFHVEARGLVR